MSAPATRLSGLTIRGRCLLAAGVAAGACGFVLDERDLLRVAAFVVVLPLLALLLTASSKIGMTASRSLSRSRVAVGDTVEVRLRLRGLGRVPAAGLLVEDAVPAAVAPQGRPRFLLDTLAARGERALRYELCPALRGVHAVGPMRVRISDPFGLAEYEKELPGTVRLVVAPRTAVLAGLPGTGSEGTGGGDAGAEGAGRTHSGHGADDGSVRQYRHGDALRRVHWRSTAHRDELMVRAEEQPVRAATTILLDNRRCAHGGSGPDSSLEWAISFAASAYLHLRAHGQRVRLVTDDGVPVTGETGTAEGADGGAVLGALAALRPSHRRELVPADPRAAAPETLAVLGTVGPQAAARLARSSPGRSSGAAVLLDVPAWSAGGAPGSGAACRDTAEALAAAGWAVVLARPGDPVTEVWRALTMQPPGTVSGADRPRAAAAPGAGR